MVKIRIGRWNKKVIMGVLFPHQLVTVINLKSCTSLVSLGIRSHDNFYCFLEQRMSHVCPKKSVFGLSSASYILPVKQCLLHSSLAIGHISLGIMPFFRNNIFWGPLYSGFPSGNIGCLLDLQTSTEELWETQFCSILMQDKLIKKNCVTMQRLSKVVSCGPCYYKAVRPCSFDFVPIY